MPAMSSASIALSAAAIANSNAALSAARRAECMQLVNGYEHDTATVAQSREYAGCVFRLYGNGEPLSGPEVLALKIAVVVALIGVGVGAWVGREDGWGFAIFGAVLGAIILPALVAFAAALLYGAYWVVA